MNFGAIVCAGTLLVGERGQDDQQLRRRLRRVGLVHRDFGDERVLAPFVRGDVAVDLAGLLDGQQVLARDVGDVRRRDLKRLGRCRGWSAGRRGPHARRRTPDRRPRRGCADEVGHVEGEEVAGGEEAVHGLEADVVGVDVVGPRPAQRADGGIGLGADAVPGSVPMIVCSRLDLFQTGAMSTPSGLRLENAASWACPGGRSGRRRPCCTSRASSPLLPSGMECPMERQPARLKAEAHPEEGPTETSPPTQDTNASSVEDAVGGRAVSRRNRLFLLDLRPMPRSPAYWPPSLPFRFVSPSGPAMLGCGVASHLWSAHGGVTPLRVARCDARTPEFRSELSLAASARPLAPIPTRGHPGRPHGLRVAAASAPVCGGAGDPGDHRRRGGRAGHQTQHPSAAGTRVAGKGTRAAAGAGVGAGMGALYGLGAGVSFPPSWIVLVPAGIITGGIAGAVLGASAAEKRQGNTCARSWATSR